MDVNDNLLRDVKAAIEKWMSTYRPDFTVDLDLAVEDSLVELLLPFNNNESGGDAADAELKNRKDNDSTGAKVKASLSGAKRSRSLLPQDLALLIVDQCKELKWDEELQTLRVLLKDFPPLRYDGNKEVFKNSVLGYDNEQIEGVHFKREYYCAATDKIDESYDKLEMIFTPLTKIEKALDDLFSLSNVPNNEEKYIMPWDMSLVTSAPEVHQIFFPMDYSKASAVIVTGESGSGKSWFAKKWLPYRHPDASFIYYKLDDKDAEFGPFPTKNQTLGKAYQTALKALFRAGLQDTKVYHAVSELSWKNDLDRNTQEKHKFDALMDKAVAGNAVVQKWWKYTYQTVKKLVIVIDDVGKCPELARGLVEEVRHILMGIRKRNIAKKVMLVLVGSGLDHFIDNDSVDLETDAKEKSSFANYGTDPGKSKVVKILGPDLESSLIWGIPSKDIMQGTYSSILATNTRMLTRGILPVLKDPLMTLGVENLSSRRVQLGSANPVMDCAARVYIDLHDGLSKLYDNDRQKYEALLLNQFRLLMFAEMRKLKNEPIPVSYQHFLVPSEQQKNVLQAGLITSDIISTSKALRYLACRGHTAPLYAQDGIAFEIVLQHHLCLRCRAEFECDGHGGINTPNDYYCGQYELGQAWPPASSKDSGNLTDESNVIDELSERYEEENIMERLKEENGKERLKEDVTEIKKLLENKSEYDLVLRQTVSNVQGADVLVLSKRSGNKDATLDLYGGKHYKQVPCTSSNFTIDAFASLGVGYKPALLDPSDLFDTQPRTGFAGYSFMGTMEFVSKLSLALGIDVKVRYRIVTFSSRWENFDPSWKNFNFETAKECNLWIWTREMLEPTISALRTRTGV